jgi:transcriptional regulator of arginine metabolism
MYIYTMKKSTIQRQRLIADFIDSENVSSQNQLKGLLKKNNIQITQATLSRDLNELGAIKKRLKNGRLIYVLPKNQDNNAQVKIAKKALEDFVLDVEPVSNQVVVKTTTAAAQVIAESIDNLYIDNIVASIAGDNVVLIISTDESKAREVAKTIEDNIK